MPCHTIESLCQDEHLTAVGVLGREVHPTEGDTISLRGSVVFDGTPSAPAGFAQPQGWENIEILTELGFAQSEIEALQATGALVGVGAR
jgi:crotonobetainyl-CoA:carnitine CoA-transferase CaiB-like acyl-CoA transferase